MPPMNTPTRGVSPGSTGTEGPQIGQSAKEPTTLADVSGPVGSTEPKLAKAMQRFKKGMGAIRGEVREMKDAFEAASLESSRRRGIASVLRVLAGLEPMLQSAEDVTARALGTSRRVEDVRRVLDLGDALDEEPLTRTTDADRVTEPRKRLDPTTQGVVDRVTAGLEVMRQQVRKWGFDLQDRVQSTNRPDGVRESITELSKAVTALQEARQNILSRFR